MYQPSKRQNLVNIFIKPTSIAIMGSIGLHALIPPSLPILTQLEKPVKKSEPVSVKVLELSSSELQRIPQSPQATSQIIPSTAPQIPISPVNRSPIEERVVSIERIVESDICLSPFVCTSVNFKQSV